MWTETNTLPGHPLLELASLYKTPVLLGLQSIGIIKPNPEKVSISLSDGTIFFGPNETALFVDFVDAPNQEEDVFESKFVVVVRKRL